MPNSNENQVDRSAQKEVSEAKIVFNYFKDLRNKHIIHDENSYAQSIPGAILNKGNKSYKIEKIICLSMIAETLTIENFGNLKRLIDTARSWVIESYTKLCHLLTKELEEKPYNTLLSYEDLTYQVPQLDSLSLNRDKI